MNSFNDFLGAPAFNAKPPKLLPVGNYPGQILKWATGNSAKGTPYIRVETKLTGWDETIDESEREGIDPSKKIMSRDYFLDPADKDSFYYIDQLLRSCGVTGGEGATYMELLPQLQGAIVTVSVGHRTYTDKQDNVREVAEVKNIFGDQG